MSLSRQADAPSGEQCAPHCLHQLARSLGNTVDARDMATYNHSREVADISIRIAKALDLPPQQIDTIHFAAHLHDIGKIGIPDAILGKKGPLTPHEYAWMRRHPEIGASIVGPVTIFNGSGGITEVIRHHHERYDGAGYPDGMAGEAIPFGARIIAVGDTISALIQDRPYRQRTTFDAALKEVCRCRGSQFDPLVVDALLQAAEDVKESLLTLEPQLSAASTNNMDPTYGCTGFREYRSPGNPMDVGQKGV